MPIAFDALPITVFPSWAPTVCDNRPASNRAESHILLISNLLSGFTLYVEFQMRVLVSGLRVFTRYADPATEQQQQIFRCIMSRQNGDVPYVTRWTPRASSSNGEISNCMRLLG